jgi:glycosyltransferase involved in cell wall biosynthesis
MSKKQKVSIIIPVKNINQYLLDFIPKILELDYKNYEIIVIADEKYPYLEWPKTRIISSSGMPGQKRNIAVRYAKGEILAFLDDDSYPKPNWLNKALRHFSKENVAAVGGPAITPKDSSFSQTVSGAVYESYMGGGFARNRYLPVGKTRKIYDWPTVNLLIRKKIFKKVGGFNQDYLTGEDTKLCLDIINTDNEIVYDPQVIVYHHRRTNLFGHLKQVSIYGFYRGYFSKKHPQTSSKLEYFIPSIFFFYFLSLVFRMIVPADYLLSEIYSFPFMTYIAFLCLDAVVILYRKNNLIVGLLFIPLTIISHLVYGFFFIKGLFVNQYEK